MGKKWVSSAKFYKRMQDVPSKIEQTENVNKNFETVNTGFPGMFDNFNGKFIVRQAETADFRKLLICQIFSSDVKKH
jgi:hypothetical protein